MGIKRRWFWLRFHLTKPPIEVYEYDERTMILFDRRNLVAMVKSGADDENEYGWAQHDCYQMQIDAFARHLHSYDDLPWIGKQFYMGLYAIDKIKGKPLVATYYGKNKIRFWNYAKKNSRPASDTTKHYIGSYETD